MTAGASDRLVMVGASHITTPVEVRERLAFRTEAIGRLSHLSEKDRQTVQALASAIVNKLLHNPIVTLKQQAAGPAGETLGPAVRELFQLDLSPSA